MKTFNPQGRKSVADAARDAYILSLVLAQYCFIAWGGRSVLTLEFMGELEQLHHKGMLEQATIKTLRRLVRRLQRAERPRRRR